eukprot:43317-Prymnesium_polylepis.1
MIRIVSANPSPFGPREYCDAPGHDMSHCLSAAAFSSMGTLLSTAASIRKTKCGGRLGGGAEGAGEGCGASGGGGIGEGGGGGGVGFPIGPAGGK